MTYKVDDFPGRIITLANSSYHYFGGTSYLGLQNNTAFQQLYIKNLRKYGTNYAASRNANVQLYIFETVEHYLAQLVSSESCITLSSGFLASQLVVKLLHDDAHQLFYAPGTHIASHHAKAINHGSFDDLNNAIRKHLKESNQIPVVLFDTLDVMGENYPAFQALKNLPLDQIILVGDDSHGIGVVGENGQGSCHDIKQLNPKEVIVCCSLGKGFGIQAGAIFCSKQRTQELRMNPIFGGASPAAPAALACLMEGKEIIHEQQIKLRNNIDLFHEQLLDETFLKWIKNYPVFTFSDEGFASYLETKKIIITNFNYPSKNDKLVSRIVLSAAHNSEDIIHLTKLINHF